MKGQDEEGKTECVHHWRIQKPVGEMSSGVCALCGASRDFRNSRSDAGYRFRSTATSPRPIIDSGANPPGSLAGFDIERTSRIVIDE